MNTHVLSIRPNSISPGVAKFRLKRIFAPIVLTPLLAFFVQISTVRADTTTDINAALTFLGLTTNVTTATPDQLRQAVARAVFANPGATPSDTATIASTYVTEVLALRYPIPTTGTPTQIAQGTTLTYTNRVGNAALILTGAVQGMRGSGITDATAYRDVATTVATTAEFQPASNPTTAQLTATDSARAALAGAVVAQLNTTVSVKLGSATTATSLAASPTRANAVAPIVAESIIASYASLDDGRNSLIVAKVLASLPAVSGVVVTQATRDAAIGEVAKMLVITNSYMVSNYEFVARLAKADSLAAATSTLQSFASWMTTNAYTNETDRLAFATGGASFGRGATTSALSDAQSAVLAAGIASAFPADSAFGGKVAANVALTLQNADLAAASQAANPLDLRGAVVLAGVTKVFYLNAPDITAQYLVSNPLDFDSNAPAFAVTVVKSLPVVVNTGNQTTFAATAKKVTGVFTAAGVSVADIGFQRKADVTREVVRAVATFTDETVKQVALQVASDLTASSTSYNEQDLAVNFATAVAGNTLTPTVGTKPNVTDATKALIASGVAHAFPAQAVAVASTVAELNLGTSTATVPKTATAASRAVIVAAVSKAVPASTQAIVAQVAQGAFFTTQQLKLDFGNALITALPTTTAGLPNAAKFIAAGLLEAQTSTITTDSQRIDFAKSFVGQNATNKVAATAGLIAAGVATKLDPSTLDANAPALAAGVATIVNLATSAPTIAAGVANIASAAAAANIASAVATATFSIALTDANRTSIAVAVVTVKTAAAADVAGSIATLEVDGSKAALATGVAKIIYLTTPAAVGDVAASIAATVTATNVPVAGVSPADTFRQGIALAAVKSALPTTINMPNAQAVNDAAVAVALSVSVLQSSSVSKANLANTLVAAVPTFAGQQITGLSTIAGNIASAVAQSVTDPNDKAAVAKAAAKASTTQAVNIATAVASRGAGTAGTPIQLDDAGKALVAQQVALASTAKAVDVANAVAQLVTGDAVSLVEDSVVLAKASVAKAVVISVPASAALIAAGVAGQVGDANKYIVAREATAGLPGASAASAGPVAKAVADLTTNATFKGAIAAAVVGVIPAQVVTIATSVATGPTGSPLTASQKGIVAAAAANAIPSGSLSSLTVGAPAVAKAVAAQIVLNGATADADIATITKAVAQISAGAGDVTFIGLVAKTVAANFITTKPTAAPAIAGQVTTIGTLNAAQMGAIAKDIASGVPLQAPGIATSVLPNLGNATAQAAGSATIAGQVAAATGVATVAGTLTSLASAVATVTPTSAPAVAAAVAGATGVAVTNAAAIANAVALTRTTAADKGAVANAVVSVATLAGQAVTVATTVSSPLSNADKATIAAAVTTAIPAGSLNSTTVGAPAVAKAVAAQITVTGLIGAGITQAAADIAAIAKAVAAVSGGNQALVAGTVAGNFSGSLAAAAPTIADEVAKISGLSVDIQAAIAKSVAAAVTSQSTATTTTVLNRALATHTGTGPDSIAGTFAVQIPANAVVIAGTATTYIAINGGTTRAGDIAATVATSAGVATSAIPGIATAVANAISGTLPHEMARIADSFASRLLAATALAQAGALATNLAGAIPSGHLTETEQLAGIVTALAYAIPATNANAGTLALVAKNVATVAANAGHPSAAFDIVGYLVAELIVLNGSSAQGTGTFFAALRSALLSTNIPLSTINSVMGSATNPNVTLSNARYTSDIATAGRGTIGGILSETTVVTNF